MAVEQTAEQIDPSRLLPSRRSLIVGGVSLALLLAAKTLSKPADAAFQTFLQECTDTHLPNNPTISIKNSEIIGVFTCFPDLPDGKTVALDPDKRNKFLTLLDNIGPFYEKYMGIKTSTRLADNYLMLNQNSDQYPLASDILDEALRRLPLIPYDRITYRSYCLMYIGNNEIAGRIKSFGGWGEDYGMMIIPHFNINYFKNGQPGKVSQDNTNHEAGHRIGMQHNTTNTRYSIMAGEPNDLYNGEEKIVDIADIQGICTAKVDNSTPTPTPNPNLKPRNYLPVTI